MRRDPGEPALILFLRIAGQAWHLLGGTGHAAPFGQMGRVTPPSSVPGTIVNYLRETLF